MAEVIYEKRGRIAYITLNRPHAMNAIDEPMHKLLWQTWQDFDADNALDLAIVTGAGDEAFCAGADLKTHATDWVERSKSALFPRDKMKDGLGGLTRGLHRIYKPVIAAVNGWALAGGLETAMACDIRIASENAQFGSFEPRRGYHHGDGGIVRVVNACGVGIALEMNLTAEPIDAQRALQVNMVSKVVRQDKLMETAEEYAAKILRNDQWAVRSAKETIFEMIGRRLDDQLAFESFLGYTGAANPPVAELLSNFAAKTDKGRVGKNKTDL
jgi:enoyl-CoA hydratase/carnithine racemase